MEYFWQCGGLCILKYFLSSQTKMLDKLQPISSYMHSWPCKKIKEVNLQGIKPEQQENTEGRKGLGLFSNCRNLPISSITSMLMTCKSFIYHVVSWAPISPTQLPKRYDLDFDVLHILQTHVQTVHLSSACICSSFHLSYWHHNLSHPWLCLLLSPFHI